MSVVIEDFTETTRMALGRHAHAFYSNWEAVIDGGRIAEQGRYADLIARGGVFSGLVATQRAGIESA